MEKKQQTVPATRSSNPWLQVAKEAGSNDTGKLLKFIKGVYESGDDTIPDGTEFVAHIDQLVRGWVRFEDGKVIDRNIVKIADDFKMPKREELGDTGPKKWTEKDADGKRRDPWSEQWFLPLISVASGDFFTFISGSRGGIGAIRELCNKYGHQRREGLLPIIALKVRSYKHKQYGRIETPDFAVVGWDDAGAAPPLTAKEKTAALKAEMNDDIPF